MNTPENARTVPAVETVFGTVPSVGALRASDGEAQLADGAAPAIATSINIPAVARTAQVDRVLLHHLRQRRNTGRQAEPLKLTATASQATSRPDATIPADVLSLFMALPFLMDSTPRAYRLKAGNAAPPISTADGTFPPQLPRPFTVPFADHPPDYATFGQITPRSSSTARN